jgi:nucleoside-diphosphate kinase
MKHHKDERTLVIVKPDGVQRSLIGEVIGRYERLGLKLTGIKMLVPQRELVEKHYTIDPEWKRKAGEKVLKNFAEKGIKHPHGDDAVKVGDGILTQLKSYFSAGPVIAMVWKGAHAVAIVRKITGGTEPLSSDVGTIRGDFMLDSYEMSNADGRAIRNIVHASGSKEEAETEIDLWFKKEELVSYRLVQDSILYDVNIDGILE